MDINQGYIEKESSSNNDSECINLLVNIKGMFQS